MPGRRELLEAAACHRRRLVTALVSAGPVDGADEPPRPGRAALGGAVLASLLVAGAAVLGVVAPRSTVDWSRPGLVVSSLTGASYVVEPGHDGHPLLRPVADAVSARLVLGTAAVPTVVDQGVIDGQQMGAPLGLPGAPTSLPAPARLVESGWTACTRDAAGVRLGLAPHPAVEPVVDAGVVVRSGTGYHLLAPGPPIDGRRATYRYVLPRVRGADADNQDNLLADLRVGIRRGSPRVPADWLALVPAGAPLAVGSFHLRGPGRPVRYAGRPGVPADARVGDVLTSGAGSLLLTHDGPARLDAFALAVYRASAAPSGRSLGPRRDDGGPRETRASSLPPVAQALPPYARARWPDRLLGPVLGDPCLQLATGGAAPRVRLVTGRGAALAAAGVPRGRRQVSVDGGAGALVRTGGGRRLLVDAGGRAFPLVGDDIVRRLGYSGRRLPLVPDAWAALLPRGVRLSTAAVRGRG